MGPQPAPAAPVSPSFPRVSLAAIFRFWGIPSPCSAAAATSLLAPPAHIIVSISPLPPLGCQC
eukprot:4773483-Karenia_brevis.AAC.1